MGGELGIWAWVHGDFRPRNTLNTRKFAWCLVLDALLLGVSFYWATW